MARAGVWLLPVYFYLALFVRLSLAADDSEELDLDLDEELDDGVDEDAGQGGLGGAGAGGAPVEDVDLGLPELEQKKRMGMCFSSTISRAQVRRAELDRAMKEMSEKRGTTPEMAANTVFFTWMMTCYLNMDEQRLEEGQKALGGGGPMNEEVEALLFSPKPDVPQQVQEASQRQWQMLEQVVTEAQKNDPGRAGGGAGGGGGGQRGGDPGPASLAGTSMSSSSQALYTVVVLGVIFGVCGLVVLRLIRSSTGSNGKEKSSKSEKKAAKAEKKLDAKRK